MNSSEIRSAGTSILEERYKELVRAVREINVAVGLRFDAEKRFERLAGAITVHGHPELIKTAQRGEAFIDEAAAEAKRLALIEINLIAQELRRRRTH